MTSNENASPAPHKERKKAIPTVIVLTVTFVLAASMAYLGWWFFFADSFVMWKEEVKLNDGRVIIVDQKKLADGFGREAWLTINLPEFSAQPIVWHEFAIPILTNIDKGQLYVVGFPPTDRESRHYGNPKPPYVCFRWEHGIWHQIPFKEVPESIYTTNMLLEGFPPRGTKLLTLERKNSREVNGDPRMPDSLLHLNPKMGNFE